MRLLTASEQSLLEINILEDVAANFKNFKSDLFPEKIKKYEEDNVHAAVTPKARVKEILKHYEVVFGAKQL
jgi:hypothetical protein